MSDKFIENLSPLPKRKEFNDNPVKLCNDIARIFRARMREDCDIDGVMSQQGARLVLSLLAIEDGKSQREIVAQTHLSPPTVSVIIKKMQDEGMVELRTDDRDMRITRVYLTDFGRATDDENINKIKSVDTRGLRGLTEEENATLMVLLSKIRDNLLCDDTTKEKK